MLARPYVIAEINGGLGNQLFQYAAGRALADRLGMPLLLDTSWYQSNSARQFNLVDFKPRARAMGQLESLRLGLSASPFRRHMKKAVGLLFGYAPLEIDVAEERDHDFVELPKSLVRSIYMRGCWQNIRYFADDADLISQDLVFSGASKVEPSLVTGTLHPNAVAVHVRRTDYLTYRYSVCGVDYYRRAISKMASLVPDLRLFFFSDDIEWAQQNLQTGLNSTFISPDPINPAADLWLMSRCRHRILANSSFSWWAAWLSEAIDGVVIAPEVWLRGKETWTPALPHWMLVENDATVDSISA